MAALNQFDWPRNLRSFWQSVELFAKSVKFLQFDGERQCIRLGAATAQFAQGTAFLLEALLQAANDPADVERLNRDIAAPVAMLVELVGCFREVAILGRAKLPDLEVLKIAI